MKPRFPTDEESHCEYLGYTSRIEGGRRGNRGADLYVCPQRHLGPTAVARYSSEPSDYQSGLSARGDPGLLELKEAARRWARKHGRRLTNVSTRHHEKFVREMRRLRRVPGGRGLVRR